MAGNNNDNNNTDRLEAAYDRTIEGFEGTIRRLNRALDVLRGEADEDLSTQAEQTRAPPPAPVAGQNPDATQAMNTVLERLHAADRRFQAAQAVLNENNENDHHQRATNNIRNNNAGESAPITTPGETLLPTKRVDQEMCGVNCGVCLEEMVLGTAVAILPCSHWMHLLCIYRWLEDKNYCPLCRRRVLRIE